MTQNQVITEAYKKILSNKRNIIHKQSNKHIYGEKINESIVDEFISKVISVLSTIDESVNDKKNFITQQELENLKNQLQTPEDMEKYLVVHKNEIESCISRCEREGQSKIAKFMRYTLKFLWTAIKYGVPFIWKTKV